MPQISLDTPISQIFGVGDTYAKRLTKLQILTVKDLLYHKPTRYEDWGLISQINQLQTGEKVTIQGQITKFQPLVTKNRKSLQIATLTDTSGSIQIIWFNQSYLLNAIKVGDWYSLSGKAEEFNYKLSLISPEFEKILDSHLHGNDKFKTRHLIHTGRLVPIYPETYGVSSKWLRAKIHYLLEIVLPIPDWIPITEKTHDLSWSLSQIHFPDTLESSQKALQRLAHDELILLHLETIHRRTTWKQNKVTTALTVTKKPKNKKTNEQNTQLISNFIRKLPFKLTNAQNQAINEILADLAKTTPMNRLLEGDVGSGKTIVAVAIAFVAAQNHTQTAIMAPTEILAEQHYQTFKKYLSTSNIKIALQTGRKKYIKKGQDEPFDIIIGTHALLSDTVNFDNLSLVIIDEQHRFGVSQRTKLINKGHAPHVLNMTATPIPRTIALTLYGDLDISILDELPAGRKPIKTWLVPKHKREPAYEWIKKQLPANSHQLTDKNQAFIVCPFIEPSETMDTVKTAKEEFGKLQKTFPEYKLNLLHGKLKGKEKDEVIDKFKTGETDLLISTPVVEVGIDIPQASIIIIETAERFGLAQLHQLRGRVGRGGQQAYCLLFTETESEKTINRLKHLETTNNGLQLAELDLQLRGPGQIFGTNQHGFIDLKFASYTDHQLIQQTKITATKIYPHLTKYPYLRNQLENRTIQAVEPN